MSMEWHTDDVRRHSLRRHASAGTGPVFAAVHLWRHCITILLYRPPLLHPRSCAAEMQLSDRLTIVNNASLSISQILSCADMIDETTYTALPLCNQPFFVAASSWIQVYRIQTGKDVLASTSSRDGSGSSLTSHLGASASSTSILAQTALRELQLVKSALRKQGRYWLGVDWVAAVVEKQGAKPTKTSLKSATEGLNTW